MVKHGPYIGIDLGGTNVQAGVVGVNRKILGRAKTKTKADEGAAAVVARIAETAREAARSAGIKFSRIQGVGIGAPGAINPKTGVVIEAVNLRWRDFHLAAALRRLLGVPVLVDNDVNVAAWGEHMAGAGRRHPDMLAVWVGTGIGGGLILRNELYYGHHFTAGEIGHTLLHADAPRGRRTLENCASRTAVVNLLTQLIAANHPSLISDIVKGDVNAIRSKVLAKALEAHDPLTEEVISHAARYVGVAIANSVTLLSLPCVVVGGGVTESLGSAWLKKVCETFVATVFPAHLARDCQVLASTLGDDAGLIGAALLARQKLVETFGKR
ncbi:MAG: ROK family protein [Phycisphaeraceae bacterium]